MNEAEMKIENHWKALGRELLSRTVGPVSHPSFVIFFFVAIFGLGPIGLWIELYNYCMSDRFVDTTTLRSSFITFIPAFMAATCMQLIWAESLNRSLRAFAILIFAICVLGLFLCSSSIFRDSRILAVAVAIFTSIVAFWTWWIANANQKEFLDDKSGGFTNPIGGENLNAPLAGNLTGYKIE